MAAVAHPLRQEDIHPLLRHPKPIKRDTAKAHRMLGLVAHDEERIKSLQREKSITTRWLERPMYEHLEVSDIDSERDDATRTQKVDSVHEERKDEDDDSGDELSPALQSWLKPERPVSFGSEASVPSPLRVEKTKLDTSFIRRRPQPIDCPRPLSYTAQHLLTPEWTTSPSTMSPMSPNIARRPVSLQPNSPLTRQPMISSNIFQESIRKVETSQSLQIPPFHESENVSGERPTSLRPDRFVSNGSPMADKPRPRPTSFATFPHQNKRNSKIASSRGLRNNSYPNFSRPISDAPRVVPGEQMENDFIYQRFHDDEVGPPSPVSPVRHALDGFEAVEKTESRERKPKKRWSAIPLGIKNFARRRSSAAQELPNDTIQTTSIESLRQMNLTKENLQWYQNEMQQATVETAIVETTVVPETRMSAADLLPTPKNSPFDLKHPLFEAPLPLPFAPWADSPPSPASSSDNRRESQSSTHSSKRKSSLSIEAVPQHQPVSPSSPQISQPVTHIQPVSTAPQPRLTPASPFTPDPRGADSPRTATSSRRGTPLLERTCIICQTRKQPTAFLDRRITSNCWHEPATCRACLQSWVDTCLITEDWSQCTCPECGENMDRADITVWSQEGMI